VIKAMNLYLKETIVFSKMTLFERVKGGENYTLIMCFNIILLQNYLKMKIQ